MYVIINGVNSDTIRGLQILSLPPITKPKMRTSVATIDGRPGDIVTYLGYEAYNKTIKILLHDTYDLPAIMAYFNQSGTIIFSNDPDKVYTFETIDQINYERAVKFKTASVTIHAQPYKLSATEEPASGEVSTLVDKTPYIIRRTPFGTRQKGSIVGGSIVWNQLAKPANNWSPNWGSGTYVAGDNEITITNAPSGYYSFRGTTALTMSNHVMLATCLVKVTNGEAGVYLTNGQAATFNKTSSSSYVLVASMAKETRDGQNYNYNLQLRTSTACESVSFKCPMFFDLTLMFGATIADYIYTQEQATAGAGVALAKAWAGITADYNPYDPGSIKSVTGLTEHKMTGKNLFPVDSATSTRAKNIFNNYAISLPAGTYTLSFKSNVTRAANMSVSFTMSNGELASQNITPSMTSATFVATERITAITWYVREASNISEIQLEFGSTATQYEPYTVHTYPLDSSLTLRGLLKLDGDNLYYDGDIYKADGTVTRGWGTLTLNGSETWSASGNAGWFYTNLNALIKAYDYTTHILCDKLTVLPRNTTLTNKTYAITSYNDIQSSFPNQNWVYVYLDSEHATRATLTAWLAENPVTIVYRLATPTTEQAEPYTELQICDPNGTEEWVGASMPVGHETTYIDPISMTVTNEGNTESAPSITIEGEGAVEVTVDGLIAFEINMPTTGAITIDSKAMDATDGDGNLANRSVSGDYTNLQLAPGEHTVVVVGDVSNVTMKNVSRWL